MNRLSIINKLFSINEYEIDLFFFNIVLHDYHDFYIKYFINLPLHIFIEENFIDENEL